MQAFTVFLLALVICLAESSPIAKQSNVKLNDSNPDENQSDENQSNENESFERPITAEDRQKAFEAFYNGESRILDHQASKRNAMNYPAGKWARNTLIYTFHSSLNQAKRQRVLKAMAKMTRLTNGCIRFAQRTNQRDYVSFQNGGDCHSNIGNIHNRSQELVLGDGCNYDGTVEHEILHALGFYHEQNRSDRDNYLNVYLKNVEPGEEINFQKLQPNQNILYNPFEYSSIMAYGEYAFSKDKGRLKTMEDKYHRYTLKEPFDKPGMTASDVTRLKRLYKCPT